MVAVDEPRDGEHVFRALEAPWWGETTSGGVEEISLAPSLRATDNELSGVLSADGAALYEAVAAPMALSAEGVLPYYYDTGAGHEGGDCW